MAGHTVSVHPVPMVEIIVLVLTGLGFVALMAAVPLEFGESRLDEKRLRPPR